jgi:hypothetical protein
MLVIPRSNFLYACAKVSAENPRGTSKENEPDRLIQILLDLID